MRETSVKMRRKVSVVLLIMLMVFLLVFIRLFYVQIVKGDYWSARAEDARIRQMPIVAQRGIIYDRSGKKLAVSITSDSVAVSPQTIQNEGAAEEVAQKLSEILGMETDQVLAKVMSAKSFEWLKRKISFEQTAAVLEADLTGVSIVNEPRRYYPRNALASQLIGFAGVDNQGLEGVEKAFDSILKGVDGSTLIEYDAIRNPLPQNVHKIVPAENGGSIYLTVDESIQYFCEQTVSAVMASEVRPKSASILVMNPKTGEILAMAISPAGNPNDLSGDMSLFRNTLISDIYEPGSTFKMITAAVALEEGVVGLDDHFYDSGFIQIGNNKIHCWRSYDPHGDQDFTQVLQNSCNPAFASIGLRIEKKEKGLFYKYIRAFGFGSVTNAGLIGESAGLLIKQQDLRDINIGTIAMGQGIAVTPLQMITAVSAIANGGMLLQPQLIKQVTDNDGNITQDFQVKEVRRVISPQTSETMRDLLEKTVSGGTGRNAYVEGYRVAGKTGTAQKAGETGYIEGKYIASFLGFAPANDPQVAVLVLIDEPGGEQYQGGQIAAPVFQSVIGDILRYMGVSSQVAGEIPSPEVETRAIVAIPDLTNLSVETAKSLLRIYGLDYSVEGSAGKIIRQTPLAGSIVMEGSKIVLETGEGGNEMVVPDLSGLPLREVIDILSQMGLMLSSSGYGDAIAQSPFAGTATEAGATVNVIFTDSETIIASP